MKNIKINWILFVCSLVLSALLVFMEYKLYGSNSECVSFIILNFIGVLIPMTGMLAVSVGVDRTIVLGKTLSFLFLLVNVIFSLLGFVSWSSSTVAFIFYGFSLCLYFLCSYIFCKVQICK